MRIAILSIGLALMLSGARSDAAEIRALSVGSTQVAAKILAAIFREQTGHTVAVTATAPFMIGKQLAAPERPSKNIKIKMKMSHARGALIKAL